MYQCDIIQYVKICLAEHLAYNVEQEVYSL